MCIRVHTYTQADDRSVRIWRTNDWQEMKQIREPFAHCGGTTHVLRLSWSPDGKFIVTAHALNNDGPTAQIIERGDWKTGIDFVGHRKAVEVVLFNPHLFVKKGCNDNHGCVVLGSRDRSLSVWLTNLKRPLVVLHDLFTDSILDLSWSKDGYELVVCSTDGSVAYLKFTTKELGVKVSEQALDDIFMATYGSKRAANKRHTNTAAVLIEDPAMLKLVDAAQGTESVTSSQKKEMVSTSASVPSITKQIETKRSDGRRRITPITLTTQPSSLTGAPLPFPSSSSAKQSHTSPDKASTSPPSTSASIKSPPPNPIRFEPLSPTNKIEADKSEAKSKSKAVDESSKSGGVKRTLDPVVLPRAKKLKLKRSKNSTTSAVEIARPSTPQKTHPLSNVAKRTQVLLPVPEVEPILTRVLIKGVQEKESTVIQVTNNTSLKLTIEYLKGDSVLWCNILSAPALVAGGNDVLTCVVCNDRSVHLYSSKSGRLLLPSFQVSFLPHTLRVTGRYLLIVCCNATAFVWDTGALKATVKEASFASLLQNGKKTLELKSVELTSSGLPVIAVQDMMYAYHNDMCVWMEAHSSPEQSEVTNPPLDQTLPLRALQHTSRSARTDTAGLMLSSLRGNSSQVATLSYLESQVSRALLLQSPLEYAHWCMAYVRYLVSEEQELRLREFCGQFATPSGVEGGRILGLSKRGILKDLLPIIAGNAYLQRLYCELRDSLD